VAEFGLGIEEILVGLLQVLNSASQIHIVRNGHHHLPNLDLIVSP
jgi:hypothetical protein